jgi:type IV secretory pathway VirJ component
VKALRRVVLALACIAAAGGAQAQASAPLGSQTQAEMPTPTSAPVQTTPAPGAPQILSHGLFSDVRLYRPSGGVRQFVLLPLAAGDAPDAAEQAFIRHATARGAIVAAIPLAPFLKRLEAQSSRCTYLPGAFENLAREMQAYARVPGYLAPIVAGLGSAAPFAYALLAQAPAGTFAAALSSGFCPLLPPGGLPPCATNALRGQTGPDGRFALQPPPAALAAPWQALRGDAAQAAACPAEGARDFVRQTPGATWRGTPAASADAAAAELAAAYDALGGRTVALAPPAGPLADLPLVEVPVPARAGGGAGAGVPGASTTRMAVLLSGDGGWAGIDKSLAAAFAAQGIPVVGLDSLRYFWTARTPDGLARDLDRIIRTYAARWGRDEVVLIGYSQGADVLPFALNRLPAATRAHVVLAALLGPGQKASFEFHLSNWIGPSGDQPIAPEARRLSADTTLCVYGTDERGSLCPELAPLHARLLPLSGGHHFGGDYDALAARILAAIGR